MNNYTTAILITAAIGIVNTVLSIMVLCPYTDPGILFAPTELSSGMKHLI